MYNSWGENNHGMTLALKWPLPSLSPKSPQADGVQDRKLHLLGNGAMVVMIITSGGVAPSRECLEEPEFWYLSQKYSSGILWPRSFILPRGLSGSETLSDLHKHITEQLTWGAHPSMEVSKILKIQTKPWLVWFSGLSAGLQTKGSLARFPVRAHAWVAGQVPSWGCARGNHTLMFLSLSFSFLFLLSKNKS